MREWNLLLAPIATVIYFVIFPQHLGLLVSWAGRFIH